MYGALSGVEARDERANEARDDSAKSEEDNRQRIKHAFIIRDLCT